MNYHKKILTDLFHEVQVKEIIMSMKKLIINVICDCGEAVAEKDMDKQKYIYDLLLEARKQNVSLETVAK